MTERKKRVTKRYYEDDYKPIFEKLLGRTILDKFTGSVMSFDKKSGYWQQIGTDTQINRLKARCRELGDGFTPAAVEPYLLGTFVFLDPVTGRERVPEWLYPFPEWNGEDHIAEFTKCVHPTNCSQSQFDEVLREWLVTMLRKCDDPRVQNHVLILKGPQGVGKDHFLESLLGHLGQLVLPFTMQQQDKDNYQALSGGAVAHIKEYDKIYSADQARLKSLITASECQYRAAYGRTQIRERMRASWCATCNVSNILKDHTGNRRYRIVEVESIDWNYPLTGEIMGQVMAQAEALRYTNGVPYRASDDAVRALDSFVEQMTPRDPELEIIDLYVDLMAQMQSLDKHSYTFQEVLPVLKEMKQLLNYNVNAIAGILGRHKYKKHTRYGRRYYLKPCNMSEVEIIEQNEMEMNGSERSVKGEGSHDSQANLNI